MPGKLPIDRAREAQNAPKVYDEHRERFASHQAELRDANDPVSGGRPEPASDDAPSQSGEGGLDPDARLLSGDVSREHESREHPAELEDPDGS